MIRLVLVELTRLRWRQAVLLLVAAAVLIPALILGARVYDTRPISDGDRAEAQAQVDRDIDLQGQEIANCRRNPRDYGLKPKDAEARCERRLDGGYTPRVEDYLYRDVLVVARERETSGAGVVAVLAVLMLLAGTTYVGHDWASGSMSNQLLFEPRRLRVWAAKTVAVALLAALVAVLVLTLFWGAMIGVAASRDLAPTGQSVEDVVQHALRGTLMVVAGAVGGYALTTLTRSTVFTLGLLFVVAVAGGLIFGLLGDGALRYEPATNAAAVVNGRAEYYVEVPPSCYSGQPPDDVDCEQTREVTVTQGVVYYGVGLTLLGAASAMSYRRRDVP